MRFYFMGITWEAKQGRPGWGFVSADAALKALERVPPAGVRSRHYAEAVAASEVGDWAQVLFCAEAACEVADPARWQ